MGSTAAIRLGLTLLLGLVATAGADQRPGKNLGQREIEIGSPCKMVNKSPDDYVLAPCHELCLSKVWEWRFWVTNYNVGDTFGAGEHQGIGIFGHEYEIDERFPPVGSIQFQRVRGPISQPRWEEARQFADVVSRPDSNGEVSKGLLCKQPISIYQKLIYNHGRTLAQRESRSWWDALSHGYPITPLASIDILAPHWEWSDRNWMKSNRLTTIGDRAEKTLACIEQIQDGFCDAVCGNCSYVLPTGVGIGAPVGEGTVWNWGKVLDQKVQFSRPEGGGRQHVNYVRTTEGEDGRRVRIPHAQPPPPDPPSVSTEDWETRLPRHPEEEGFRDPFTHCVDPQAEAGQQALSSELVFLTPDGSQRGRIVTGLYGHNSNTDAQAEYEAFLHCARAPDDMASFLTKCEICGTRQRAADGGEEQWPCLEKDLKKRNTAKGKWDQMDRWLKEFDPYRNVDDATLGLADPTRPEKNPKPTCRGAKGHVVYGM